MFENMLSYCRDLRRNNDRTWFHENHGRYRAARADYLALLDRLRFVIAVSAPSLAADILTMQPADWMYRVARDMRYHHDGPPYDPDFRAYISRDRKSWLPIGYFLRIGPGNSCFGTGLWCENTQKSNLVRDKLLEEYREFDELVEKCGLPVDGDRVKTMPRGYDASHPAADWIRCRNWFVIEDIPDGALTTFEALEERIRCLVVRMEPIRLFLLDAVKEKGRFS